VFRGGFGLLYNRYAGVIFDNIRQNTRSLPRSAVAALILVRSRALPRLEHLVCARANKLANSYPANPSLSFGIAPDGALCGDAACDTATKVDIYGAQPKTPVPYVYVFSYEAQLEPFKQVIIKVGYQGNRSRKLVRTIDLNRFTPGDTFDGHQDKFQNKGSNGQDCGPTNPTCLAPHATGNNRFNRIFFPLPDVNASYDAMVVNVTRRLNHGLQLAGTYTWSHAIDTASYEVGYQQTDPSDPALNRANSDFDVATISRWLHTGRCLFCGAGMASSAAPSAGGV